MYIVNIASSCTHDKASFASSGDLDNISVLSDEDNDLEEEITRSFNEVSVFIFKFKKKKKKKKSHNR